MVWAWVDLVTIVAIDKAWTAAAFGLSTHTWASILTNPLVSQLAHRPRLVAVGGGYPVIESGRVIGAIGVSGGTAEQDQQAAEAALSSLDFTLPEETKLVQLTSIRGRYDEARGHPEPRVRASYNRSADRQYFTFAKSSIIPGPVGSQPSVLRVHSLDAGMSIVAA